MTTLVSAEAATAMMRAVQAYEPEATGAVIARPGHLLSVLLEASRRALAAAAPHLQLEFAAKGARYEREELVHWLREDVARRPDWFTDRQAAQAIADMIERMNAEAAA